MTAVILAALVTAAQPPVGAPSCPSGAEVKTMMAGLLVHNPRVNKSSVMSMAVADGFLQVQIASKGVDDEYYAKSAHGWSLVAAHPTTRPPAIPPAAWSTFRALLLHQKPMPAPCKNPGFVNRASGP